MTAEVDVGPVMKWSIKVRRQDQPSSRDMYRGVCSNIRVLVTGQSENSLTRLNEGGKRAGMSYLVFENARAQAGAGPSIQCGWAGVGEIPRRCAVRTRRRGGQSCGTPASVAGCCCCRTQPQPQPKASRPADLNLLFGEAAAGQGMGTQTQTQMQTQTQPRTNKGWSCEEASGEGGRQRARLAGWFPRWRWDGLGCLVVLV